MELYDMIKNITGKDNEEELEKAIAVVKNSLNGLTEERMCKVYSSYLLEELRARHIPVRLISTADLNLEYKHYFIMVPSNKIGGEYYLADLTFSQFRKEGTEFGDLETKGYQKIEDKELNDYLSIIENGELYGSYRTEEVFESSARIEYTNKKI